MKVGQNQQPSRAYNRNNLLTHCKLNIISLAITSFVAAAVMSPISGYAQQSSGQQQIVQRYSLAPGKLSDVLASFAAKSGVPLSFDPKRLTGLKSQGLQGNYSVEQGFATLLAGTQFMVLKSPQRGYRLQEKTEGVMMLDPIRVEISAITDSAYGKAYSYRATHASTGSKTNTAVVEIPQSMSVITSELMTSRGSRSVTEALAYSAGIVSESPNDATSEGFVIRGFRAGAFEGNVYRDGMKSNPNAYDGNVEPYGLERVELLRGPASVLYGQAAPGGIIHMVTKRPTEQPLHEVSFEYGTQNHQQLATDISDKLGNNSDWSYRLTGLVKRSGSMVDYIDDNRTLMAAALKWQPDNRTQLTFLANYQNNDTQYIDGLPVVGTVKPTAKGKIPRHRFTGVPGYDKYDRDIINLSVVFEHQLNEQLTLRNTTRYLDSKGDFPIAYIAELDPNTGIASRSAQDRKDASDLLATDLSLEYRFVSGIVEHSLLVGADYMESYHETARYNRTLTSLNLFNPDYRNPQFGDPVAFFYSSKNDQKSYGLYLQDQIKIDKKWVVTLGGRKDWSESKRSPFFTDIPTVLPSSSEKSDAFTGRAGVVYLSETGWAPYVGYSESFQPESGTDRSGKRFKPTTGQQFELGVRYQPSNTELMLTAAVYQLTQQNVTTTDPIDTNFSIQTGEKRSRGAELEVNAAVSDSLDIIGSYAYTEAEITKDTDPAQVGLKNGGVPKNQLSIWTEYEFSSSGLSAGVGVRYIDSMEPLFSFLNDQIPNGIPSYTLVDAKLDYIYNNWKFSLKGKNITDKKYLTCTFACFWGEERSVIGSVTYDW